MGVIDVGSNTARLVIADTDGAVPLPVHTAKRALRLAEHVDRGGHVPDAQVARIVRAVAAARAEGRRWGVTEPFAFATAIVRDAPNRADILRAVATRTGLELNVLPGEVEAELTFLAARRWMGWRAGPLAMLDIGGGSLEVAFGRSKLPDFALSLPLGAGRLTREFFGTHDPPAPRRVKELRRHVRHQLRDAAARLRWEAPRTTVATSRTFQQLARLCGAAPGRFGPFTPRGLTRADLRRALGELACRSSAERAELPGISAARARQSLAGALVAHTVMKLTAVDELTVCPWGLREGILLRCIEDGATDGWSPEPAGDHASYPATGVPALQAVLAPEPVAKRPDGRSARGA